MGTHESEHKDGHAVSSRASSAAAATYGFPRNENFTRTMRQGEFQDVVHVLDAMQLKVCECIVWWSEQRLLWRQGLLTPDPPQRRIRAKSGKQPDPPKCRILVEGAAGTGKTYLAQLAIAKTRNILGSSGSVLTVRSTRPEESDLGTGARTVDSIFKTNTEKAALDLKGNELDNLVSLLRNVELLVIDDVQTVAPAAFEIMSRRLQQVGRVLWIERFGRNQTLPDGHYGFGGIGVMLTGDWPATSRDVQQPAAEHCVPKKGKSNVLFSGSERTQNLCCV